MRAALINSQGNVVNVVVVNDGDKPPPGHSFVKTDEANIGDTWDGAKFTRVVDLQKVAARVFTKTERLEALLAANGLTIADLKAALARP